MPEASLLDTPPAPADTSLLTNPPPISDPKQPEAPPAPDKGTDAPKPTEPPKEAPTVPESYADPKLPEGYTITPEIKTSFDALAKELKLSQESYQKVIDLQIKHQENEVKAAESWLADRNAKWAEETKKEFSTPESLAFAAKAIDRVFQDPKEADLFRKEMAVSGYGNWNLMVKLFTFIGKSFSEDKFVDGKPAPAATEKSLAQRLYPSLPSSPNSF